MVLYDLCVDPEHVFVTPSEDILVLCEEQLYGSSQVGCHPATNPDRSFQAAQIQGDQLQ